MSLDIYLTMPLKAEGYDPIEVFSINITHNLGKMANAADLYYCMWRPEELGITKAGDVIELLNPGLALLKKHPDLYKQFNPPNGWGDYNGLVRTVETYLEACKKYPEADIYSSR